MRPDGYLYVRETARLLDATDQMVRGMFDRGELSGTRSPKGYRLIATESVNQYRAHLSVAEASVLLGCSTDTVRSRFDAGRLRGYRTPAGRRRIDPESLRGVQC